METLSYIVHQGLPHPVEARLTTPDDPGAARAHEGALAYAAWFLGLSDAREAQRVTPENARKYSFVFACQRYIAGSIASLGWHVFERQGKANNKIDLSDDVAWLLGMQASPEMDALNWRQTLLLDALGWGNGYAEIETTNSGRPVWMYRISPDRVTPTRDDRGRLVYEVDDGNGKIESVLPPERMFHLKHLGDGLVGWSPIEIARRAVELGLSQERYGQQFFRRGPMPGGVVKLPGSVKKAERDEMRDSFQKAYGGSENAGKIIVLSGGAEFGPLSIPNDDAQFVESRDLQGHEIARIYGVPPHKVGLMGAATFSNIEHQAIEAVQDCLLPWCRRLEMEADVKLFGRNTRGRRYTRLNLATLLRGDTASQTQAITSQVTNAIRTVNEGRELLDLNPIEGGDTPLVQGAMVPLESVLGPIGKDAPDETSPAAPETDSGDGTVGADQEEAAATGNVQATALNGAQILGLLAVADKQILKQVSRDAAEALIKASFPLMSQELVSQIVDEIESFEPEESEEQAPAPPPAPEEGDDEQEQDDMPEDMRRVFGGLLTDAYGRLLRYEADKAGQAERRGRLAAWAQEFYTAQQTSDHVVQAVWPVLAALAIAVGKPEAVAGELADRLAAEHVAAGLADPSPESLSSERAARQAAQHLALVWESIRQPANGVHA